MNANTSLMYDALHAAAGSALRAWMDTHHAAVERAGRYIKAIEDVVDSIYENIANTLKDDPAYFESPEDAAAGHSGIAEELWGEQLRNANLDRDLYPFRRAWPAIYALALVSAHDAFENTRQRAALATDSDYWPRVREAFLALKNASKRASSPGLSGVEQQRRAAAVAEAKQAFVDAFPAPQIGRALVLTTIYHAMSWPADWDKWPSDHYPMPVGQADEFAAVEREIARKIAVEAANAPAPDRLRVFLSNFYALHPALARFASVVPVKEKMQASPSRHPDASNEIVSGKDAVVLYPKFWTHGHDQQASIFAHELGHWVLSGPYGYTTARYISLADHYGVDVWDTPSLPFAAPNMEEAFADAFASYYIDKDVVRRYPKWVRIVETIVASGAGVPIQVG